MMTMSRCPSPPPRDARRRLPLCSLHGIRNRRLHDNSNETRPTRPPTSSRTHLSCVSLRHTAKHARRQRQRIRTTHARDRSAPRAASLVFASRPVSVSVTPRRRSRRAGRHDTDRTRHPSQVSRPLAVPHLYSSIWHWNRVGNRAIFEARSGRLRWQTRATTDGDWLGGRWRGLRDIARWRRCPRWGRGSPVFGRAGAAHCAGV